MVDFVTYGPSIYKLIINYFREWSNATSSSTTKVSYRYKDLDVNPLLTSLSSDKLEKIYLFDDIEITQILRDIYSIRTSISKIEALIVDKPNFSSDYSIISGYKTQIEFLEAGLKLIKEQQDLHDKISKRSPKNLKKDKIQTHDIFDKYNINKKIKMKYTKLPLQNA